MCGILGFIGDVDKNDFIKALEKQSHRGPDAWGYEKVADNIHFGHCRLSIIDLSDKAKQPMSNQKDDLVCIFNGEIYNFLEIKQDLLQKGYKFSSNSDTEILLNAYHYYGKNAMDLFIGMFVFAIYDKRDQSLFIARDRLGIKPLFFSKTDDGFCFASEIKSILSLDKKQRQLNIDSISSYLSFRYPLLNETYFVGIELLAPGHYIFIKKNGDFTIKNYWSLANQIKTPIKDQGEEFYISKLQELVKSSVKYRMISDVPVGAYLSGGVDSSAIVAEMALLSNKPVKTFTIGFDEPGYNEFEYAKIVASLYKTEHHEIVLSGDDYISSMSELIKFKDAPLGVPNEIPLYKMSQELKKHITVVLSGEGADEIFGGYGRIFRSADDYSKWLSYHNSGNSGLDNDLSLKLYQKYGDNVFKDEIEHFLHLYRYTGLDLKSKILHKRIDDLKIDQRLDERFREVFNEVTNLPFASKMMYAFERLHLPGLLQRVDATTMAASVEARVPFVDHRLVEFAFNIPVQYKMKWKNNNGNINHLLGNEISENYDIPKYILKKSYESLLPNEVLYRKKMGFPVPLDHWFGGKFSSYAKDKILNGYLIQQDIINKDYVLQLLIKNENITDHALSMKVWMLLNLEMFLANYFS